jgi:cytochrome c biogenesis protein CcmG, thiol:disulfide interchange protein DsbE
MKTILLSMLLFLGISVFAQQSEEAKALFKLPNVTVTDLDGKKIETDKLGNDGKPFILSFWATWCKPCVKELNAIAEVYEEWQQETGVKIYAVSIDDARTSAKVKPAVSGYGWEYDIILDKNQDFKRAMNVNSVPHTFVVNGNGEVVWQHTSYSEGAELELIDIVRKVIAGQPLEGN